MQVTKIYFSPPAPPPLIAGRNGIYDELRQIAQFNGTAVQFDLKLTLGNNGRSLQLMRPDAGRTFNQATASDAFSIDNEFLGIQLLTPQVSGNLTLFKARFFKDANTRNPTVPGTSSRVVLPLTAPPTVHVGLEEVSHEITPSEIITRIDFIGVMDVVNLHQHPVVIIEPGQTVYVKHDTGNNTLIFEF